MPPIICITHLHCMRLHTPQKTIQFCMQPSLLDLPVSPRQHVVGRKVTLHGVKRGHRFTFSRVEQKGPGLAG